jgi:hypothetical protein
MRIQPVVKRRVKRATRGGKRSRTDIAAVSAEGTEYRPDPPDELSPAEQAVWREAVLQVPGGWFTAESHQLLRRMCSVVVWLKALEDRWRANGFLFTTDAEGANYIEALNILVQIATKLRLTLQSRKFKAGKAATKLANYADAIDAPWSTDAKSEDQGQAQAKQPRETQAA